MFSARCANRRGTAAAAAAAAATSLLRAPAASAGRAASYASLANAAPSAAAVNVAALGTNGKLVTVDDNAESSVLSLVFPAGSRHEGVNESGFAHHLKSWAFRDTSNATALRIARETEVRGGSLSSSITRENLYLTAEFLKKDLPFFLELLRDAATNTKYETHEARDVNELISVEVERAANDADAVVDDAIHKLAFRAGLGNSLYARPRSVSPSAIGQYGRRALATKFALVGSGVDAAQLASHANGLFNLEKGATAGSAAQAKYFGGEDRIDAATSEARLSLAYPTGPIGSQQDYAAQVLKAYLGGEIFTSYGAGLSPLSKVAEKNNADVKSFAYRYSDAGLFGVHIRSSESDAATAVKAAVAELKKAAENISAADLTKAVARAKTNAALALDSKVPLVETLGAQALGSEQPTSVTDALAKLDAVKAADVSKLVATMLKSKPTFVAHGNALHLPYADSL